MGDPPLREGPTHPPRESTFRVRPAKALVNLAKTSLLVILWPLEGPPSKVTFLYVFGTWRLWRVPGGICRVQGGTMVSLWGFFGVTMAFMGSPFGAPGHHLDLHGGTCGYFGVPLGHLGILSCSSVLYSCVFLSGTADLYRILGPPNKTNKTIH